MPRRAAIYARYSTDRQNERSIADQIALCRDVAARDGLAVVATYEDRARSGASLHGRTGIQNLMSAARRGGFDVVVIEALDRLARDMEDLAHLYKRLTFAGIEIRAVNEGIADTMAVGLKGLVGQFQREDGVKKVRRGMAGVVRDGRHAGGRPYGYRLVAGKPGVLTIDEAEAAVIRRVFAAYVEGVRPRAIAATLNAEGVPAPRGRHWNASTINGNAARRHGIVVNEIYAGTIVWNRVRMIKDPDTGRRLSRANPAAEHQRVAAAHLRIVDDATFARAQAIKAVRAATPLARRAAPKHLLSGLVKCGACGGSMVVHDRDRKGTRLRCSAMYENGRCTNRRLAYLADVERRVLAGLRERLAEPKFLAEYVRGFNDERRHAAAQSGTARARLERRSGEIARELDRAVDAIVKGLVDPETLRGRIRALETERGDVAAQLEAAAANAQVISLHPTVIARYRTDLEALHQIFTAKTPPRTEFVEALRALIARVVITTQPKGPPIVDVEGRLAALTGDAALYPSSRGERLVAEARGHRDPTGPTFRFRCAA